MQGAQLRKALQAGRRVYGIGLEGYVQPRWPRFFSRFDLDFVFLDSEHAPTDPMQQAWAVQAYAALGIAPLLRIPEASASLAAQALDAGAQGIIVPYVETVAQVKELVGAVRYRPFRGQRLARVLDGERPPSAATADYLQLVNENNLLVIMIESQAGLDNLEEMLQVDGVDGVLIGPNDLSISLGVPDETTHPKFESAVQHVIRLCRHYEVGAGVHFTEAKIDIEKRWIDWGCNLIVHLTDTLMIAYGIEAGLQALRAHSNELPAKTAVAEKLIGGGHTV